jgi:hypothetical protein
VLQLLQFQAMVVQVAAEAVQVEPLVAATVALAASLFTIKI